MKKICLQAYFVLFVLSSLPLQVHAQTKAMDKVFNATDTVTKKTQLDSLILLLPTVTRENESELLCLISRLYRETDAVKAIDFTKKSIERIEELNDSAAMARIYEIYGHTLNVQANYKTASRYFTKALKILESKNDTLSLARKYHLMAYTATLGANNSYEGTIDYLMKSYSLFKLIDNYEGMGYTSYGLGQTFLNKAYDNKTSPNVDSLYTQSLSYSMLAEGYYRKAKLNDRMAAAIVSQGEVYDVIKQKPLAKRLMRIAYSIHKRENMLLGMSRCMWDMSDIYLGQKKLDSAIFFLEQSAMSLEKIKINAYLAGNYDGQTAIYKAMNNYSQALRTSEIARGYREKSFNDNRANEMAEIRNGYENQLKDSKIQDLEIKSLLDKAELKQQNIIIIGILIVLLIIITLGGFVYQQRQKSVKQLKENIELNKLLQNNLEDKLHDSELTAARAQMNPHFVYNSINAIQNLILKENKTEAIHYLNDFSKLTRETLENSAKETITLKEEISFLEHYLQLETLRNANLFQYLISYAKDIDIDYDRIPPMMVQPFVENSIKHGFPFTEKKNYIKINFEATDGSLTCTIEDNGVGRLASSKLKVTNHRSLATEITDARLELLQRKASLTHKYKIQIEDLYDAAGAASGTRVTIAIPVESTATETA